MKRWEINEATTAKDFSILQGKAKIPISVTVAETWNDSSGITGKTTEKFWAELLNNLVESLAPVKPYCWLHFGQFHSRFHKSSFILFMCLKQITLKLRLAMEVFCLYFLSLCSEFPFSLAEAQAHRLVMVLFPSTVRHNFCFSHFGWICRALWIAKNGHESPRSPEHALNYCWSPPQVLLKCVFYLEMYRNEERIQATMSLREDACFSSDRRTVKHPDSQKYKMQGHFSYHCREKCWYFILQDNSIGLKFITATDALCWGLSV